MIICPITRQLCQGLTCNFSRNNVLNISTIACEKAHKNKIFLQDKDGNVIEAWAGEKEKK